MRVSRESVPAMDPFLFWGTVYKLAVGEPWSSYSTAHDKRLLSGSDFADGQLKLAALRYVQQHGDNASPRSMLAELDREARQTGDRATYRFLELDETVADASLYVEVPVEWLSAQQELLLPEMEQRLHDLEDASNDWHGMGDVIVPRALLRDLLRRMGAAAV